MNVRQLIEMLEEIEDKEKLVYAKNGYDDGTCCSRGEPEWDEADGIREEMIQDYVWDGKKRVRKSINVVKIDVY